MLARVRPQGPSPADRAYGALALLAIPAPHVIRTLVSVVLVVAVVATATVASSDALPNEPLYGVKVAGEEVRLALARTPEDRAAVELSMAEHRLDEAERLALAGREPDAVIATSTYGTHLANAAAELASVERLDVAAAPVVDQLTVRLADQQKRAADLSTRLANDPVVAAAAPMFATVASFAPPLPSGASVAEGIAQHAAAISQQLAEAAERAAQAAEDDEDAADAANAADAADAAERNGVAKAEPTRPAATSDARRSQPTRRPQLRRTDPPRAATSAPPAIGNVTGPVAAGQQEGTRPRATPTPSARPSARPALDPKKAAQHAQAAREAAERAKHEAEKARQAAEKAKEAAKRTASPKPTVRR